MEAWSTVISESHCACVTLGAGVVEDKRIPTSPRIGGGNQSTFCPAQRMGVADSLDFVPPWAAALAERTLWPRNAVRRRENQGIGLQRRGLEG